MKKQTSDNPSSCGGKSTLLDRIGHLFKNLLGNTLQVFHKNSNGQKGSVSSDPEALANRISDISTALDSASKGVEPQFIKLGEELKAVYFDATGLTEQIAGKAELFGEDSDQSLLVKVRERVEKCLEELRDFRAKVIREMDYISNIIEYLGQLHHKCEAFEQTTMYIRVVGLNIGVESTRCAESSEMFSVVSEEIKKVSEKIDKITKTILDDAKAEQVRQAATSGEISQGMIHLGGLADDGEQAVRQAVKHIERLMGISLKTLEDATKHAEEISKQVAEIVQGIQFHDNMSQRIEHIITAFGDVINFCRRGADETDPGGNEVLELDKAYAIMDIQAAQLEKVISEVELVHRKTLEAFGKINSKVEDLAGILPSFDPQAGKEKSTDGNSKADPISALKSALDQLQNIQKQGRHLIERVKVTTSHASETAATLSNHTKFVRRISFETHLMALNAIVKAAHLGESGRTHEVLAQEMRNLSKRSDLFVEEVEKIINQINSTAKDLTGGWHEDEGENPGHLRMDRSADIGVGEVTKAYASFLEGSTVILQRAEAMEKAISRTSGGLDFLPMLSKELGTLLNVITEARQILSPWANADQGGELDKTMALTQRYTMAEERIIHERAVGIEDDAVELFDEDPPENDLIEIQEDNRSTAESSPITSFDEDQLGDNVELF